MTETVYTINAWWRAEGFLGSPRVRKLEGEILQADMLHEATPRAGGVFLAHTPQRENQDAAAVAATVRDANKLAAVHPHLTAEQVARYVKAW
jgi:hypothetical protein